MKKLIEVIEKDNGVISFDTDLTMKDIAELQDLAGRIAFNMMTRLWGGNETMILAVIRNLAIADLAVSVNRKEMISFLDQASGQTSGIIHEVLHQMEKSGGNKIQTFAPGVKPSEKKS